MPNDYAAGASAARNKIATYLRHNGIPVRARYGCPPTDDDFLGAVLSTVKASRNQFRLGSAMVLFKFWMSRYQVLIPAGVIDKLIKDPAARHDLFTLSSNGGWNTFYLARDGDGSVKVHRRKHWLRRNKVEVVDTTVLEATE